MSVNAKPVLSVASSLLLLLLAGCATSQKPIVFLSDSKVPQFAENPAAISKTIHGLSKMDEQEIDVTVFSYLLKHKLWNNGDYAAIFLQANGNVAEGLIQKFPHHQPPIEQSSHLDLHSAHMALDQETGLPVMILGTDIGEPNADGTVNVVGRWYASSVMKGNYTFTLKKGRDDWMILKVK